MILHARIVKNLYHSKAPPKKWVGILIVSIVIISNAIMISYNNQRRQMGLLATVGATKKQLRNMILNEVGSTALIGVPIGIILLPT